MSAIKPSKLHSLDWVMQDLESTVACAEAKLQPRVSNCESLAMHVSFTGNAVIAYSQFFGCIFYNRTGNYRIRVLSKLDGGHVPHSKNVHNIAIPIFNQDCVNYASNLYIYCSLYRAICCSICHFIQQKSVI